MKRNFLLDAFSLNMLSSLPAHLIILELDSTSFCAQIDLLTKEGNLISALRYSLSSRIINTICGASVQKDKIEIKVDKGDTLFVILLRTKLNGKGDLDEKEINELYEGGKIKFFKVIL